MQHSLACLSPLAQPRTGIARLAAESPQVRELAQVAYFALPVRSALNRESSGNKPFVWTLNPYRGCEFGCKYCYARYTHGFLAPGSSPAPRDGAVGSVPGTGAGPGWVP